MDSLDSNEALFEDSLEPLDFAEATEVLLDIADDFCGLLELLLDIADEVWGLDDFLSGWSNV